MAIDLTATEESIDEPTTCDFCGADIEDEDDIFEPSEEVEGTYCSEECHDKDQDDDE